MSGHKLFYSGLDTKMSKWRQESNAAEKNIQIQQIQQDILRNQNNENYNLAKYLTEIERLKKEIANSGKKVDLPKPKSTQTDILEDKPMPNVASRYLPESLQLKEGPIVAPEATKGYAAPVEEAPMAQPIYTTEKDVDGWSVKQIEAFIDASNEPEIKKIDILNRDEKLARKIKGREYKYRSVEDLRPELKKALKLINTPTLEEV